MRGLASTYRLRRHSPCQSLLCNICPDGGEQPLKVLPAWAACPQVRGHVRVPPLRFARAILHHSYKTKQSICLGGWGLTATIAIFYVVGDLSFWWKQDRMRVPVAPQTTFAMKAAKKDPKAKRQRCVVICYRLDGDAMTGVILAERIDNKLQYAGVAERTVPEAVRARPKLRIAASRDTHIAARNKDGEAPAS